MPTDNYLHSDIQEIMVTRPSFALQWGNQLIAGLVGVLLVFAAWFQYPEFTSAEVALVAPGRVDSLVAPAANLGAVLLVPDGAWVPAGTALVAWQDAERTDYYEARRLAQLLAAAPPALAQQLPAIRASRLGALRPAYAALLAAATAGQPTAGPVATLSQQLRRWEQATVRRAAQAGRVQLASPGWPATAPRPAGQLVISLLPQPGSYLAVGTIGPKDYAAVQPGQPVQLTLQELGDTTLTGRVLAVAPLAQHQQHQVLIDLPAPSQLRLYPSFSGSARILLRRQSLLAKFLAR
jgi:hypothetical protein